MSQESEGIFSPFLRKQRYVQAKKYVPKRAKLLDIGCGSGGFSHYVPKSVSYFGIDAQLRWPKKIKNFGVAKIGKKYPMFVQEDSFDCIVSLAVIEHLSDPLILITESQKYLKNNGVLILTTPHPIGRFWHDYGAKIGWFSHEASEEHEQFIDLRFMNKMLNGTKMKLINYRRFLFGFNQIFVLKKTL